MGVTPSGAFARLEEFSALDPIVDIGRRELSSGGRLQVVEARAERLRLWLGHPAHPAFAKLSAGLLLSAAIVDWVPGTGHAVPALTTLGMVSAVPSAMSGAGDWSTLPKPLARVGVVHAGLNVASLLAHAGSLVARGRGHSKSGRALTFIGSGILVVSGGLGGHLLAARDGEQRRGVAESVLGVEPSSLGGDDLDRELDSLHRTRADTLRHGSADALAMHTARQTALEAEYQRRYPERDVDPQRLRQGGPPADAEGTAPVRQEAVSGAGTDDVVLDTAIGEGEGI